MTALTVGALQSWEPGGVRRSGEQLARQAGVLRELGDEVVRLAVGLERSAWTGAAADAHRAAGESLRVAFEVAADGLDLVAQSLRSAAEVLELSRALLLRAQGLAARHDLVVLADGRVPPPVPQLTAPHPDPAIAARLEAGLVAASSAEAMAVEALASAQEVDRDAAAVVQSLDHLPRLRGILGDLLRTAVSALLLAQVGTRALPPAGASAERVAAWWAGLPATAQQVLVQERPAAIGRLDGLPVDVRDRANRLVLDLALRDSEAAMAQLRTVRLGDRVDLLQAVLRLPLLRRIREQLDRVPGATLLAVDLSGPGRAVLGIGDVEHAQNVAVLVPGLGAHVLPYVGRLVGSAVDLQQAAAARARSLRAGSVATVAWIGYDAPGLLAVTSDARAQVGAGTLRQTLRGLDARAVAAGRDLHLTVSGHSYGSLVSGYALRERTGADDLVVLGSPGVGVGRARELFLPRTHVFVGEAAWDPVADLSRFGGDPGDDAFGARRFQTDGRTDPVLGDLGRSTLHSAYYGVGTESLDNVALITIGRSDLVSYR